MEKKIIISPSLAPLQLTPNPLKIEEVALKEIAVG